MGDIDNDPPIEGEGYTIKYGGGRLADVIINGVVIECVQVREYDFATGEFGPVPSADEIREQVAEFVAEAGGVSHYEDEAAFYTRGQWPTAAEAQDDYIEAVGADLTPADEQ